MTDHPIESGVGAPTKFPDIEIPDVRTARRYLSAIVERALDMLDQLDGNPDLEDGGDLEPSLGWTRRGMTSEMGDVLDLELDDSDDEPWLGWVTSSHTGAISFGGTSDREVEDENDEDGNDAEEDKADYEPSLGWTLQGVLGGCDDMEDEHDGCEPETDSSVDDDPCDACTEDLEPEPEHWRRRYRERDRATYAKRWSNVSPVMTGPSDGLYQWVKIGGSVNG